MTPDPTTDDKDASSRMPCQGKVAILHYKHAVFGKGEAHDG